MPVSINGTTGLIDANVSGIITGNLTGDVTGNLTGTASNASAVTNGVISAEDLNGNQTGSAPIYGCRAWVNFDGTRNAAGTIVADNTERLILGSGNVSSVLRNALGVYTITFTIPMIDANYAVLGTSNTPTTTARGGVTVGIATFDAAGSGAPPLPESVRIQVRSGSTAVDVGVDADRSSVFVAIFR